MQLSSIILLILGTGEIFAFFRGILIYKNTWVREYAYFSLVWLFASITSFTSVVITETNETLTLIKIREISFLFFFLSLYLHSIRRLFKDGKMFVTLKTFGWVFSFTLAIVVLIWNPISTIQWYFPPEPDFSLHVGFKFKNLVYSNKFPFVRNIFGLITFLTLLYSYFFKTSEFEKTYARKSLTLWKITAIFGTAWSFIQTFWFLFLPTPTLRLVFALVAIISFSIITFFYPEGFVSSHAQIYRASKTYKFVEENPPSDSLTSLHQYIKEALKITKLDEEKLLASHPSKKPKT